jgi:membrane-bound ClpP family serine protease
MQALLGATGIASTPIAPTGIVMAQGEAWTARSRHGSIRPGESLTVVGVDGLELIVEPAGPLGDRPSEKE